MKLFILRIDSSDYLNIIDLASNKFSSSEFAAVEKFKFDKGKATKSISLMFTKYVAERIFGLKNYLLLKNAHGKPYIKDYSKQHFNISHSGNWIICGVSEFELGVDIEEIKPMRDILEIATRFFSIEESTYLISLKSKERQLAVFYEIWTKKESFIKAVGQGLSLSLSSFDVPLHLNSNRKIIWSNINWYFKTPGEIDQNYKIAVCEKENDSVGSELIELTVRDLFF